MTETPDKFLTTRQLALMWAVSEATIKRWADAGLLRVTRTVGGHRRFAPDEVARFERARGLGSNSARRTPASLSAKGSVAVLDAGAGGGTERAPSSSREAFLEAIVAGRETESSMLLLSAMLDGVAVADILDEVVAPAMRQVGSLWYAGRLGVADEHLATRTAVRALESLSGSVRRRYAGVRTALCCASEGELHEVAVLGLQVLLESEAWRVTSLGGNTPFFALADAVARHRPSLVCVSSTMGAELERTSREFPQLSAAVRACDARLVLGGEGFRDAALRRRFPADLHAESFAELQEFLNRERQS
ncbi:MAG TPA: B12-binding domain-containing protein [Pyrinomonadaceae bacterium]|nr:B12-binding domain-containing protein [Pyrinomonadaceae bacterium]